MQEVNPKSRRHLLHGGFLLVVGLFILGSYISIGPDVGGGVEEFQVGAGVGVFLVLLGSVIVWGGKDFFSRNSTTLEYYESIVIALGIALTARTFAFEPFKIPSGSMIPTLLVGDYLFVNKFSYGYRIPYTQKRVFMGAGPHRGDVVVFEFPNDPTKDYIKRIIGLPGDEIVYQEKQLYVNGTHIARTELGPYEYFGESGIRQYTTQFSEVIDGKPHTLLVDKMTFGGMPMRTVVPEGRYFVMGDNRDNSNDSRYWGFVPEYRLVGRAVALFWSRNDNPITWWNPISWWNSVRWGRLFTSIQ
ncbi:putative signal peptidase I [Magnetofaba australis IT-1]|uniref:Signal peptidase I n=1 Tax=Magnetofaba australis IT-1 TaxID=1434232 RepID=A0A1Y2K5L1_9PROT|nr:putative signal peptidase I [Magnetofaba australis IT-1]